MHEPILSNMMLIDLHICFALWGFKLQSGSDDLQPDLGFQTFKIHVDPDVRMHMQHIWTFWLSEFST